MNMLALVLAIFAALAFLASLLQGIVAAKELITHSRPSGQQKKWLVIISICIMLTAIFGYASYSASRSPSASSSSTPSNTTTPNTISSPTATPSPTPTPTPTAQVIPINQTSNCTNCSGGTNFSLIVKNATIDPANSQVTLLIGIRNNSTITISPYISFLKLQDTQTGVSVDGAGLGSIFPITANQVILFRPTFQFVPVAGHEYSLSAELSSQYDFSPITIKFR